MTMTKELEQAAQKWLRINCPIMETRTNAELLANFAGKYREPINETYRERDRLQAAWKAESLAAGGPEAGG